MPARREVLVPATMQAVIPADNGTVAEAHIRTVQCLHSVLITFLLFVQNVPTALFYLIALLSCSCLCGYRGESLNRRGGHCRFNRCERAMQREIIMQSDGLYHLGLIEKLTEGYDLSMANRLDEPPSAVYMTRPPQWRGTMRPPRSLWSNRRRRQPLSFFSPYRPIDSLIGR